MDISIIYYCDIYNRKLFLTFLVVYVCNIKVQSDLFIITESIVRDVF